VLSEKEYNALKTHKQIAQERERNLQIIMKLRPALFDLED
jgi:hypothetical protein